MVYNTTGTILDRILSQKAVEVAERQKYISKTEIEAYVQEMQAEDAPRDFAAALRQGDAITLIAEVKKASPSKGVLIEDFDPVVLGKIYAENGAAAISVLTDKQFFQGDLKYLYDVRQAVLVPVLKKDFVIDPYQLYAARAGGADAVLLIVAALADAQLAEYQALAKTLGMTALVEVHDEKELERALAIGATVIGVNNRDLKTFEVDLQTTGRIARLIPEGVILVAESGISSAEDVQTMGRLGATAVLVGESLVKSADIAAAVRAYSRQGRL